MKRLWSLAPLIMVFSISLTAQETIHFFNGNKEIYLENNDSLLELGLQKVKTFKTENQEEIKVDNKIILKLKPNVNPKEFFERYDIENYKNLYGTTYVIYTDYVNIDLANEMYCDEDTIFAQPNISIKREER